MYYKCTKSVRRVPSRHKWWPACLIFRGSESWIAFPLPLPFLFLLTGIRITTTFIWGMLLPLKFPGRRIANYITFYLCLFYFPKFKWQSFVAALQPRWPLTGVIRALRARNPRKVGEKFPRGRKNGWKKGRKKVKNESKTTFFRLFFNPFLTPGPRGPGNFFLRLFWGHSGPKGPNDPCKGPRRL